MSVIQVTQYKSFGSLCGLIVFSGLYRLATHLCLQRLAARLCLQQLAARLRLQGHHICACLQQQLARVGQPLDENISAI